jgi:hypothetical protein
VSAIQIVEALARVALAESSLDAMRKELKRSTGYNIEAANLGRLLRETVTSPDLTRKSDPATTVKQEPQSGRCLQRVQGPARVEVGTQVEQDVRLFGRRAGSDPQVVVGLGGEVCGSHLA